jgi:hypothetical protein
MDFRPVEFPIMRRPKNNRAPALGDVPDRIFAFLRLGESGCQGATPSISLIRADLGARRSVQVRPGCACAPFSTMATGSEISFPASTQPLLRFVVTSKARAGIINFVRHKGDETIELGKICARSSPDCPRRQADALKRSKDAGRGCDALMIKVRSISISN